jgi:hypothetical protein
MKPVSLKLNMKYDAEKLRELREKLEAVIKYINSRPGPKPGIANIVLENEAILIASLQNGLSIRQACLQAGIGKTSFYDEKERNQEFSDRIDRAEQYVLTVARQNIVKSVVSGNISDSWRLLERKDPDYKPKSDLTSGDMPFKPALVEFIGPDGNDTQNTD